MHSKKGDHMNHIPILVLSIISRAGLGKAWRNTLTCALLVAAASAASACDGATSDVTPCDGPACDAPMTCGDGIVDDGEACDDGNFRSHDGCHHSCQAEEGLWTQRTVAVAPPGRHGHALAYDAKRGEVVLFGGVGKSGWLSDTWVWNGITWTARKVAAPPARSSHALTYDALREEVVLFGGYSFDNGFDEFNDTWVWNGSTWAQRVVAVAPPARHDHALTYDAARGEVVLFGGRTSSADLSDTWVWNGSTWTQRAVASAPSARRQHALTYDAKRGEVVLFGGADRSTFGSDTWVWNGNTWTQRDVAAPPPGRIEHALTYDAVRGEVVVFGGTNFSLIDLSDTWVWNGATWTQRTVAVAPPELEGHALTYDALRREVVLFGGYGSSGQAIWVWQHRLQGAVDEVCTDASDADGDGLAGCADPDCDGLCDPQCVPYTSCDPSRERCGDNVCTSARENAANCPSDCG
jgi:cysteine-rich repeat protein